MALGIGAALATPPATVWAEEASSSVESSTETSASSEDSSSSADAESDTTGHSDTSEATTPSDDEPAESTTSSQDVRVIGGVTIASSGGSIQHEDDEDLVDLEEDADTATPPKKSKRSTPLESQLDASAPADLFSEAQTDEPSTERGTPSSLSETESDPTEVTGVELLATPTASEETTVAVVEQEPGTTVVAVSSPLVTPGPADVPFQTPAQWALLAAARREIGVETPAAGLVIDEVWASLTIDPDRAAYIERFRSVDPYDEFYTPASPEYDWSVVDDPSSVNFSTLEEAVAMVGTAGFTRDREGRLVFTNTHEFKVGILYAAATDLPPEGLVVVQPGRSATVPGGSGIIAVVTAPKAYQNENGGTIVVAVAGPGYPTNGSSGGGSRNPVQSFVSQIQGQFNDAATMARNAVTVVMKGVEEGLKKAQQDVQKRIGDAQRIAAAVGGGLGQAASNVVKSLEPVAKIVTNVAKAARGANVVSAIGGFIWDNFINPPKAG
ncbi:hypothetical protein [Mycolicibacterium phlei]